MTTPDHQKIGSRVIEVRGACEHNLKNLDLDIEREALTVITGVSGSGKSSLAFDTILAEAQRRFFYTLSHYSRQFLDLQSRPTVRRISGLSPAVSLAQNETPPSLRATVASLTDIGELLGVLFARFGVLHCPEHGLPTSPLGPDQRLQHVLTSMHGQTVCICAPVVEGKKGVFKAQLRSFAQKGYVRVYIDGRIVPLTPMPELAREEKHTIKLIVDTVKIKDSSKSRLLRSIDTAIEEGQGYGEYYTWDGSQIDLSRGGRFASKGGCSRCGFSWPRLDARHFSANSLGRCPSCNGLGITGVDGASAVEETSDESHIGRQCLECDGVGIKSSLRAIHFAGVSILDIYQMTVAEARKFITDLAVERVSPASDRVRSEILQALSRIAGIGLHYLHLKRRIRTLSGGESQRLKLAGILAENLRGVLYVLDEPSQGLHPSELANLCKALTGLANNGNTVLVVDHDETIMKHADWIIDLGPSGGAQGGRLLAKFPPQQASMFRTISTTARYLSDRSGLTGGRTDFKERSTVAEASRWLQLENVRLNNLRIDRVRFAKHALNVVTGVSGAGKSSLVLGTLFPNLVDCLTTDKPGGEFRHCTGFTGYDDLRSVHLIDRKPLGRSSVSMPVSYLEVFVELRRLFARTAEAQIAGLTQRSFSLSVEGGRCPECGGRGETHLKMQFLADARVRCSICKGFRFQPPVLDIRYRGLNLFEVLQLTIHEALAQFANHKKIVQRLRPAADLGLGYLKLGQPSLSLSGGEAQRLKLVPHFARSVDRGSVLILDEPTAGLHFEDVGRLLNVLHSLVDRGATVVIIEHNADVIVSADRVVDLGPGSAHAGGTVVFQGQARDLRKSAASATARYLV